MTMCDMCNTHLSRKVDIVHHLETVHNIHVRMGEDSHLAYCNDCHKYLGKKATCFNDTKRALEKHLSKVHAVELHEGDFEFEDA
eukprot:scaffold2212_cov143-Cylindrotheca_fusiformis.AAC.8